MSFIVDRRLNPKNKSAVNRQRFLGRYRKHIRQAVDAAVSKRSITDMEHGESVTIPGDDVSEPVFGHGAGGRNVTTHPGNKEFSSGDRLRRPDGGGGSGRGKPSNSGEGEDDFAFELSRAEFMDFLFEGLALPNLVKRALCGNDAFKFVRAGYSTDGLPTKLNVVRSFRAAKGRRIALSSRSRKQLAVIYEALLVARESGADEVEIKRLEEEAQRLRVRLNKIPFLDTFDLRYNLHVKEPLPTSKAVMFCLMDVSGSMDQRIKELAKRFFLLLYLFLERHYEHTEIVFIRHHTTAKEVDEQEFFHSRESGGTVVSSALKLMGEIQAERYDANQWNIYGAQASDGDNWGDDSPLCTKVLNEAILPLTQYFSYVEITSREPQSLWHEYSGVESAWPERFARRRIQQPEDIFPVFRQLFERKDSTQAALRIR